MRKLFALLLLGAVVTPAARAELVFATTNTGRLISFDSGSPGTILSNAPVSGVAGSLVGIDFRPARPGLLYGLGNNGGVGTVYTINTTTGAATPVYTLTTALSGTSFGVDFNPVPDALRITSNTGQNLRIAGFPTGNFTTNVDGTLSQNGVVGSAYTNSFLGVAPATTTLFNVQDNAAQPDILFTQIPPNAGTLNFVGNLTTPTGFNINASQLAGFDIGPGNIGYLSWNGGSQFGPLDLATGGVVNRGAVGGGFAGTITGIAVTAVPEPGTLTLMGLGVVGLAGVIRRRVRG